MAGPTGYCMAGNGGFGTKKQYSEWLDSSILYSNAKTFGWTCRNRAFWASSQWEGLEALLKRAKIPADIRLERCEGGDAVLHDCGSKPWPRFIAGEGGYVLKADPQATLPQGLSLTKQSAIGS